MLRFLGIVKYIGKFIPNQSQVTAPLRELNRENISWEWKDEEQKIMTTIRELLVSSPTLRHYNPKEELVIQTDASQDGLGSVLLQNNQPLSYASRSLMESEKKFA